MFSTPLGLLFFTPAVALYAAAAATLLLAINEIILRYWARRNVARSALGQAAFVPSLTNMSAPQTRCPVSPPATVNSG
jgi:hypothetical protein